MAEFSETMKQWRRMCSTTVCIKCPLSAIACGSDPDSREDDEIELIMDTVEKWAAEHPEPVYPTWNEWLISVGFIEQSKKDKSGLSRIIYHWHDRIPADIAEKLGIEPKEDV